MSIKIYTYTNPYALEEEEFWDEIRDCPHFCVSQTLVNGLKSEYKYLEHKYNISTIRNLINSLYKQWDEVGTKVKQMVEVDNAINNLIIDGDYADSTKKSLYNNVKSITDSIRILANFELNPFDFKVNNINIDQKYVVDIYKEIYKNKQSCFKFKRINDLKFINNALIKTLEDAAGENKDKVNLDKINLDTVVIHGIHQFTPPMLCAIEDLSKFKTVVLLFNYQKQYQKVYQTWLDIYSLFNVNIKLSANDEFTPNALIGSSYRTNVLADCVGKMLDCEYHEVNDEINQIEVLEFENNTEFANYVAQIYEDALYKKSLDVGKNNSTLRYMTEQFYSASSKVNNVLRAYFPEQFAQRHFLDYPIGHFFIATMNMWDSDSNKVVVNNFSDIKECLTSGILSESRKGVLISTFNKILPYIEDLKDYDLILTRIRELKKNLHIASEEKQNVGFFNVHIDDLIELISALFDLKGIIESFYSDFQNGEDNFKHFYSKVKKFIKSKVDSQPDFDSELVQVMNDLLDRMSETDIPNAGSFITLRQTLSYYLSQDENINHGARWIVRGFEQIDGDILKSNDPKYLSDYHFCCLSDKDICASRDEHLPWPLDLSFFDFIQIPLDWKYQIYIKSKTEYHNFNRYALLYGLEFARNKCKLSYVKNEDDKENDLYYILSMLGLKIKRYSMYDKSGFLSSITYPNNEKIDVGNLVSSFDKLSKIRISICPYKFGMEQLVQNHTIFRDRFLIHMYMKILLRNKVLEDLQGQPFNEKQVKETIKKVYSEINNKFRICTKLEEVQLIAQVYKDVTNPYYVKNHMFKILSVEDQKKMIYDKFLLDYSITKKTEILSFEDMEELLMFNTLPYKMSSYCKYCASRDICLGNRH